MIIRHVKTIGDKGRLTLPSELLRLANLKIGDDVYFTVTKGGNIVIRKYKEKEEDEDSNEVVIVKRYKEDNGVDE